MQCARRHLGLCLAVAGLCACPAAWADDAKRSTDQRAACLEAHESAQLRRLEGQLLDAREQLLLCARDVCPGPIRADCSVWVKEVDQTLPSVVVAVTSRRGDEPASLVFVDGKAVAPSGRALSLDPGTHRLRVELPPYPPIEQVLVILEGERERKVMVHFEEAAPSQPAIPPAEGPRLRYPAPEPTHRPVPWVTWALSGVTVVGAISTTFFGLTALSARDEQLADCAPLCDSERKSEVSRAALVADISLAVAVAAGLGVGYTYLTRPRVPVNRLGAPRLSIDASARSAFIAVGGSF